MWQASWLGPLRATLLLFSAVSRVTAIDSRDNATFPCVGGISLTYYQKSIPSDRLEKQQRSRLIDQFQKQTANRSNGKTLISVPKLPRAVLPNTADRRVAHVSMIPDDLRDR